jgi:hypothetical protein
MAGVDELVEPLGGDAAIVVSLEEFDRPHPLR